MERRLWPHQDKAVTHVLDWAADHPYGRLLLVLPPGGGKTLIVAELLGYLVVDGGMRALVIAHRREMVFHHYNHLIDNGVDPSLLGIIMADDKRRNPDAPIQIASVDSLHRRNKTPADIVVTDEAQRDASDGRRKLRAMYGDALRLGITGSPCRVDGRGLGDDFDEMYEAATAAELLSAGYIVAPTVYTVPKELRPDLGGVSVRRGDYDPRELERAVNSKHLVGAIVPHWRKLGAGRKTVVFATSIEHSKSIAQTFLDAGISAAHLDVHTSDHDRSELLRRFEHGDLTVLSCVNILAEGWDCPPCKCIILARPTCSLNLHLQQCGRCMRPWKTTTPLILDHAGNMLVHGLPQMERTWLLTEDRERPGGEAPAKYCEQCMAIMPAGVLQCTECGAMFPEREKVPEEVPGELRLYVPSPQEKATDWQRFQTFARARGFGDEWAQRIYQAKYGDAPAPTGDG